MQLYELTIYDMSEEPEEYHDMFFIGIFSSFENAEEMFLGLRIILANMKSVRKI